MNDIFACVKRTFIRKELVIFNDERSTKIFCYAFVNPRICARIRTKK